MCVKPDVIFPLRLCFRPSDSHGRSPIVLFIRPIIDFSDVDRPWRKDTAARAQLGSALPPSRVVAGGDVIATPRAHYELLQAGIVPCTRRILKARRTLSVTGRPDMVHNCTTSNTSTNSFSVRCAEGFNGGLPQSFLLEVRESNTQELRANLTSPVPRFSVTQLESGALYQACVYAYNDKGRSEAMVVQAGTFRLPEKQLTSESGEPLSLRRLTSETISGRRQATRHDGWYIYRTLARGPVCCPSKLILIRCSQKFSRV